MVAAVSTDVTQGTVLAAAAYPAQQATVSQADVQYLADGGGFDYLSQAFVLVAAAGRVSDPRVRSWTFTLDGHDFYVLRLGNVETLVYDVHSEQWYVWGSDTSYLWRAYSGCNWLAGDNFANVYGSNVVVGDDGNGSIYLLNPDSDTDDDAVLGSALPRTFSRRLDVQMPLKGFDSVSCFDVVLEGSIGENTDSVNLSYSDDRGNSFTDAGDIQLTKDTYNTRLRWQSLGSASSPGRIYSIADDGALRRIDYAATTIG